MFSKFGRMILKKMLFNEVRFLGYISCRKISIPSQGLFDRNLQPVLYDDDRVQKHLKFLIEASNDSENRKNTTNHYETLNILNSICSKTRDIDKIQSELNELNLFITDLKRQNDELVSTAISERDILVDNLEELKKEVLHLIIPVESTDDKNIILELSPGVGGQEAMLFAKNMFEMYCNYAQWKGWNYEILKYDTTDLGGIRTAHIGINGVNAFKIFKFECGVHRVQRVPKTEKAGRIHTSTMTVAVLPQPTDIDIVIHPNDIEMEFKRSSGAGGQHVNKTESCVRIYHKPTGLVAESQMERNQYQNKELAMKSLRAKLYERELEAVAKETKFARRSQIGSAARSEKVRTYNFPQDRITDHRAHLHIFGVESFFKGEDTLDKLLAMLQDWSRKQSLMEILNKYDSL